MIDEVIDRILKTEEEAELIIKEAENKATEITSSTNVALDTMDREYTDQAKKEVDKRLESARAEADKKATEIAQKSMDDAQEIRKKAQKNLDEVTKTIVDMVLKGRI